MKTVLVTGGSGFLGRRIVDVDGVYQDQNASVSSLVSNLTTFEQDTLKQSDLTFDSEPLRNLNRPTTSDSSF